MRGKTILFALATVSILAAAGTMAQEPPIYEETHRQPAVRYMERLPPKDGPVDIPKPPVQPIFNYSGLPAGDVMAPGGDTPLPGSTAAGGPANAKTVEKAEKQMKQLIELLED